MNNLTGRQIRDARIELGWSQSELAARSKVEFSSVFAIELYNLGSDEERRRIGLTLEAASNSRRRVIRREADAD